MDNHGMHKYVFVGSIRTIPGTDHEVTYKCAHCGYELVIKWPDQLLEFYAGECTREAEKS